MGTNKIPGDYLFNLYRAIIHRMLQFLSNLFRANTTCDACGCHTTMMMQLSAAIADVHAELKHLRAEVAAIPPPKDCSITNLAINPECKLPISTSEEFDDLNNAMMEPPFFASMVRQFLVLIFVHSRGSFSCTSLILFRFLSLPFKADPT